MLGKAKSYDYVVDAEKGPYYTVQAAIDAALANGDGGKLIYVCPGSYPDKVVTKDVLMPQTEKERLEIIRLMVGTSWQKE